MEDKFDTLIEGDKIIIFGFASEVETQMSIEIFNSNGSEYVLYDLETEPDAKQILAILEKRLGTSNTPLFYYGGNFLGDYIDIKSMDNERKNSQEDLELESEGAPKFKPIIVLIYFRAINRI